MAMESLLQTNSTKSLDLYVWVCVSVPVATEERL